jgi:hypothetical protein
METLAAIVIAIVVVALIFQGILFALGAIVLILFRNS